MEERVSLKSLAPFEVLTAAEAAVFERELVRKSYRAKEGIRPGEDLIVVRQGSIGIWVEAKGGRLAFGEAAGGELLGEMDFFEPDPVPMLAEARTDAVCYTVPRRALKNTFRYSRTGATKFMGIFARSLSRKIRSANELLNQNLANQNLAGGSPSGPDPFRPAQLGEVDLHRLKGLSVSRSFPADTVIFREGEVSTELFVIGKGDVEILKETASGQPLVLARLGTGDFFGEMAFIDQRPRSATAIARSPLEVSVLPAQALERAMEHNLGTALYLSSVICKIMARRLNSTLKRIASL